MNKEIMIALAREAGLWEIFEQYSGEFSDGNPEVCLEELERFAALVAAHEHKAKPITADEMSAWVKDTWEKRQAEAWQEQK